MKNSESELQERLFWLIRLRWVAVLGVIGVLGFTANHLHFKLPYFVLGLLIAGLALCNLLFYWLTNLLIRTTLSPTAGLDKIANLQISLDLFFLVLLIHFSGGIENPFIFYFIFHIIIAGILLSRLASFAQAILAVCLFVSLVGLEYTGVLPHYPLKGFIPVPLYHNLLYIYGVSFVFISTLFIAVYMASSVSKRLKQANEALRAKDRVKSEYVLRVSHDIKEHLSAIQSCVEPVASGLTGTLNEKQKDLLDRAVGRTSKLLIFVRALLEITRLKLTQKLEMREFSLTEMIESIAEDIGSRAKSKGLRFVCEIKLAGDKYKGVRVYLEEALTNLLVNAVKYTNQGEVELLVNEDNRFVQFRIADTGIGIAAADLSHVFEEFYRAENARQMEKMGTGLGLAVVKKIVEMHKGKIWIESVLGQGTSLFIKLPKV